ncbi:site-specific integrase [Streptomyces sp. NPDC020192]|uniref:site-specific integrase n=1 Tax=Streptomyces sp. NPDC020192 TaxID=3365066 RepID=UPI00379ABF5C
MVSPELADVLSTIITRIRDPRTGAVPRVVAYDYNERIWNPPMPLLFQYDRSGDPSHMTGEFLRACLNDVLEATGLTDASGLPLDFDPHDFRRIFITDAIRSGLPPHIAQVIAGHADINTTMGYNDPRELHQTGEKPQVASSERRYGGLQRYYELAS